jgi:putative effector of murein hydrolase LrgA (UPF0299 family)
MGLMIKRRISNPVLAVLLLFVFLVTLYTTSVYWAATNERATLCNGAISNLRVINAARSPNAVVFVTLKFAIDTPVRINHCTVSCTVIGMLLLFCGWVSHLDRPFFLQTFTV